jgi:serine/threonine protein kinase
MTLAPCPQCGTNTTPGLVCTHCGTPTPDAPVIAPESSQWQTILQKLQRVAAPKYLVRSVLGYGGMAGVYLADEPRLGRKVAIKVMAPALMMDPRLVERFNQEARTIAQLSHPNIVTVYEVDERDDLHWFTMTFVGGRTLGQVLSEGTSLLGIDVVRAWLYQIGDALAFAHQNGVVHRDIKPGNVLLDLRGNALVTDFGIAKVADAEAGLTRTGILVGTPAYMSPEQCSAGTVTGASDQYALGAVAYQMLTGQPPFAGPTLSVLQAHVTREPTPLTQLRSDCPAGLAQAINRMLQKRPEDRWPSISAAITAAGATPPGLAGDARQQLELLAAPAVGLTVSPWPDVVAEGMRQQLQVLVVDENGRVLPDRRVDWSTNNPQAATVSDQHRLHAFSPGLAQINARSGTAATSLAVAVRADPIGKLDVRPARAALRTAERLELDAVAFDLDGSRLDDRAVLWTSSNPAVAPASSFGLVSAVAAGHAQITAHSGGQSATISVTVTPGPATDTEQLATAASRITQRAGALPATTARSPAPTAEPPVPRIQRKWLVPAGLALLVVSGGLALAVIAPWQQTPAAPAAATGNEPQPDNPLPPASGGTSTEPAPLPITATAETEPPVTAARGQAAPAPRADSSPATASPPAVQDRTALVRVEGELPEGASISVTDAFNQTRALSGRSIRLDAGTYSLEFRAPGYETDRRTLTLRAAASETWSPSLRRVAPQAPAAQAPTQPAHDPRADQTAIENQVRNFVNALDRRDQNSVLPLLPRESRAGWSHLLTHRDVQNFRALLNNTDAARVDGATATIQFSLGVSYRNLGENISETLNWIATLDRTADGWRLSLARPLRN